MTHLKKIVSAISARLQLRSGRSAMTKLRSSRASFWLVLVLCATVGCGNYGYNSGDRVLVAKDLYETKLMPPERFDVVVFKFPKAPMQANVPTNYIKRLLGLPGEIIVIFFGQLFKFTPPPGEAIPGLPHVKESNDLWRDDSQPNAQAGSDDFNRQVKQWFAEGKFEMIRKPAGVMLAMRRIVNDNNFQAKDLKSYPSRWQPRPESGWKLTADRKQLSLKASDGKEVDWITYQHLARPEGPLVGNTKLKPRLITDTMGYNDFNFKPNEPRGSLPNNWVGDLMIEANVTVTQPTGDFFLELNRGPDRFQAKWDLASGQCTLLRLPENGPPVELGSAATTLRGAGTHLVRFANFDARLTVWIDRTLPFGDGVAYDPPELPAKSADKISFDDLRANWGPRRNDIDRPASLGARNSGVDIGDLRLWRDTYYTKKGPAGDVTLAADGLEDPDKWGEFKTRNPLALYVYPGHYLCLGDNSTHSSDGREWGLVPERLMLGRALMVYFPLERAGLIR